MGFPYVHMRSVLCKQASLCICRQRAARLTILAISESIYRQANRTGGGIFQEICAGALPGQFAFNDSSESKNGAISGVKTGVISGTNYPTLLLWGIGMKAPGRNLRQGLCGKIGWILLLHFRF